MRLNTHGRYGIQMMVQLACHASSAEPQGLKKVGSDTGLPWRYLEQIARPLKKASLVRGRTGRTGGYVLARQPDTITLRDVIEAASGPICLKPCVDDAGACEHSGTCTSRQIWEAVTKDIRAVLAWYTLCDLAKRPCAGCRGEAEAAKTDRIVRKSESAAPPRRRASRRA